MDLVRCVEKMSEALRAPDIDPADVNSVFVNFLHKKATKEDLDGLRQKLIRVSTSLYKGTRRLNRLLDDPRLLQKLNSMVPTPIRWGSRLMSLPLLRSAIVQLKNATSVADTLLAASRLISIVEDSEERLKVPFSPRIQGKNAHYNNIYYYLMKVANWTPEARNQFIGNLHFFSDKVLQRISKQAAEQGTTIGSKPRPHGWE